MSKELSKRNSQRVRRIKRVRKKVFGLSDRPRLCIVKSNKCIYTQVIDDMNGKTICSASTMKDCEVKNGSLKNCEAATLIGKVIGIKSLEAGITKLVVDRRFRKYGGVISSLVDAVRNVGIAV